MMLFLNILTVVVLALVAGLLLTLWLNLRMWRESATAAPVLAERLTEQLLAARRGLEELKKALMAVSPEVSKLLSDGRKMQVDLEFVMQRAEQVAKGLAEGAVAKSGAVKGGGGQVVADKVRLDSEAVAGANGKAVQVSAVAHDPLEDLLAGLQAATGGVEGQNQNDNVVRKSAQSRRRTPVTQAELDLQQKIHGQVKPSGREAA